jgi:predicted DNA-binding helix-hairpin-helix protein
MIIGATPSPDRDVLRTADRLYKRHDLRRVYYSAYSPTPFGDAHLPTKASPLVREHRLYQADWLLRFYGFSLDEVVPADIPMLSHDIDPKLAWALRHRGVFPIDLNRASKEMLLRVPGLGVRTVSRLLSARRFHRITQDTLMRLKVRLRAVAPFVQTADCNREAVRSLDAADLRRIVAPPRQLALFAATA